MNDPSIKPTSSQTAPNISTEHPQGADERRRAKKLADQERVTPALVWQSHFCARLALQWPRRTGPA